MLPRAIAFTRFPVLNVCRWMRNSEISSEVECTTINHACIRIMPIDIGCCVCILWTFPNWIKRNEKKKVENHSASDGRAFGKKKRNIHAALLHSLYYALCLDIYAQRIFWKGGAQQSVFRPNTTMKNIHRLEAKLLPCRPDVWRCQPAQSESHTTVRTSSTHEVRASVLVGRSHSRHIPLL